jgi:hypothetical protein
MADTNSNQSFVNEVEQNLDKVVDIRPTLFIGVGGTGMEVLLRVRRKILNNLWGSSEDNKVRVDNLADFPVAQFLHFDLDSGAVIDSGKAQIQDLQFDMVKFSDDERIVERFNADKYLIDDDTLEGYQHIKDWFPLPPDKARELKLDPSRGAGQVRAISRLFFFDKYALIRDRIRSKLNNLKAGLTHEPQLNKLGLKMETGGKFRIVVVGSVAGGTGSGAFLDMGWLSRWLGEGEGKEADVELMLFLPTGYASANKDRTEANGYAALMELEAAMCGNKQYVGRWDAYDLPTLKEHPYKEVYLLDTGNLAQQHTKEITDVYHMLSEALFEDFANGDFARKKRSVAVNQQQHKIGNFDSVVNQNRFQGMKLSYSRVYSAFGQSSLDTRIEAKRDQQAHVWAGAMLRAFFGIGSKDSSLNRATDKQRDDYMSDFMLLKPVTFSDFPKFSERVELRLSTGDFIDYVVIEKLLQDRSGSLLSGVEQRVNNSIENIRNSFDRKEWNNQIRDAVKQLEQDAVRDINANSDAIEDRITMRRKELVNELKTTISNQLYTYLDNNELGGLAYVLSLVEQIKDRISSQGRGFISSLKLNAERYREIKEAVRTREYERLLKNLDETKGGLFGSAERQSLSVIEHIRVEVANGIKFHLRAKAADEAVLLMQEISNWLGNKNGVDANGEPIWSGLVGDFQKGRSSVLEMLQQLEHDTEVLKEDLKKEYVTRFYIPTKDKDIPLPSQEKLGDWAKEAFKDFGGSKEIFKSLQEPDESKKILLKIRRMAEHQISTKYKEENSSDTDPLIEAFENMAPNALKDVFTKFLSRAMPWVDVDFTKFDAKKADQFKCIVGVPNDAEFKKRFESRLRDCLPSGLSSINIVTTGVAGRAVCYIEYSGMPLTILRGLEGWRTSYRKESGLLPLHTHKDKTQFNHPLAPSPGELNRLAEDFKYYILAIMLGIFTRVKQRVVPAGQYQYEMDEGLRRRIGNERDIRQNGLPVNHREKIVNQTEDLISELDALGLFALSEMCKHYEKTVYPAKVVSKDGLAQDDRKGFATTISHEVNKEILEKAMRKGLSESNREKYGKLLKTRLLDWSESIPTSDEDAYAWEINEEEADDGGLPRLKIAFKTEYLKPGKIESLFNPAKAGVVVPTGNVGGPPPLTADKQYHLAVNKQQLGVFDSSQISAMILSGQINPAETKAWSKGFPDWLDFTAVPELMALLSGSSSTPPPLT